VHPSTDTAVTVLIHSASRSTGPSGTALAAAAAAALIILLCLGWGIARLLAYEPRWILSLRHSLAEAAYRVEAALDELGDWIRIGH